MTTKEQLRDILIASVDNAYHTSYVHHKKYAETLDTRLKRLVNESYQSNGLTSSEVKEALNNKILMEALAAIRKVFDE